MDLNSVASIVVACILSCLVLDFFQSHIIAFQLLWDVCLIDALLLVSKLKCTGDRWIEVALLHLSAFIFILLLLNYREFNLINTAFLASLISLKVLCLPSTTTHAEDNDAKNNEDQDDTDATATEAPVVARFLFEVLFCLMDPLGVILFGVNLK